MVTSRLLLRSSPASLTLISSRYFSSRISLSDELPKENENAFVADPDDTMQPMKFLNLRQIMALKASGRRGFASGGAAVVGHEQVDPDVARRFPGWAPTPNEYPTPDGNWMYGALGKKIPKPPKGTKIGKMVMGDVGLYKPEVRAAHERDYAMIRAGAAPWETTPARKFLYNIQWVCAALCLVFMVNNIYTVIFEHEVFLTHPYFNPRRRRELLANLDDDFKLPTTRYA